MPSVKASKRHFREKWGHSRHCVQPPERRPPRWRPHGCRDAERSSEDAGPDFTCWATTLKHTHARGWASVGTGHRPSCRGAALAPLPLCGRGAQPFSSSSSSGQWSEAAFLRLRVPSPPSRRRSPTFAGLHSHAAHAGVLVPSLLHCTHSPGHLRAGGAPPVQGWPALGHPRVRGGRDAGHGKGKEGCVPGVCGAQSRVRGQHTWAPLSAPSLDLPWPRPLVHLLQRTQAPVLSGILPGPSPPPHLLCPAEAVTSPVIPGRPSVRPLWAPPPGPTAGSLKHAALGPPADPLQSPEMA